MPAIPINQVPNAPDALPGYQEIPQMGLPRGGQYALPEVKAPNFGRSVGILGQTIPMLQQEAPRPVQFIDYESRAWADFGETTRKVGGQLMDFAVQMQRTQDEGNLARVENMLVGAYGDFNNWAMDKQPDQLDVEWAKRREKLAKEIETIPFSQTGAAKRDVLLQSNFTRFGVEVATTANKMRIKDAGDQLTVKFDRELANGMYEEASATAAKMHTMGYFGKGGYEQALYKVEDRQKKDQKELAYSNATSELTLRYNDQSSNLSEVKDDLMNALKTGESKFFPEFNDAPDKSRQDFLKILATNDQLANRAEADRYSTAVEEVLSGKFKSDAELRGALEGRLPKARIEQVRAVFNDSPEERQRRMAMRPAILQKIKDYEAAKDQTHEQLWNIQGEIQGLPDGNQQDLREMLFKKWRDGNEASAPKPSTALGQAKSQAKDMLDGGLYGGWKADPKTKMVTKDTEGVWMAANERYSAEMDRLDQWAEANPKEAADASKVYAKWNEIRTSFYEADRAAGRNPVRPPVMQAPKPQDVLKDIQNRRKSSQATPASIRNNNPGAMWPAKWQEKFGGIFGEKLNDGQGNQIARFPTPEQGAAATMYLLAQPSYSGLSVREGISKWSGGNSVESYLSRLRDAGFSPGDSIATIMADKNNAIAFVRAMSRHEADQDFPMSSEQWQRAYTLFQDA